MKKIFGVGPETPVLEVKTNEQASNTNLTDEQGQQVLKAIKNWVNSQITVIRISRSGQWVRCQLNNAKPKSKAFPDIVTLCTHLVKIHKDNNRWWKIKLTTPRGPIIGRVSLCEFDKINNYPVLVLLNSEQAVTNAVTLDDEVQRRRAPVAETVDDQSASTTPEDNKMWENLDEVLL